MDKKLDVSIQRRECVVVEKNRPLIRVKNLKKYFPVKKTTFFEEQQYVKANDGITLEIFDGETVGLVGESGCGKSTLGRTILQLYEQTDGATFYYGRSLEDLAPKYVFTTIKNLEKDVANLESNREERRKCRARLDEATNEKDKKRAQAAFDKVDKKIDEYFDTTIKIFGALVLSDDLKGVAKLMHDWYTSRGKIIRTNRDLNLLRLRHEAETTAEKHKPKIASKIASLEKNLETYQATLNEVDGKIAAVKENLKSNEKFERYEARRDTGIDLARLTYEEMRLLRTDLQIIFQDPYSSLNPRMTIGQLIGEALVTHGYFHAGTKQLNDYILEVMDKSGLQDYMIHRYPHEFSGGQRQRVGIARALALRPKFIVADEAVSALDVSIQSQVINLLKDLQDQEGFSFLFISHDLGVVRYISDRIGVMYLGDLVELAPTEKMFKKPLHPYTEALLESIPTTERRGSIVPLEGDVPSPVNPPSGCKFHTRCKYVMDICRVEEPEWREVEPGHFVACHLYNEKDTQ